MEFNTLIAERGSIRAYKPDPVEDEKLQALLDAARLAPTAANRQPFRLIVIQTAGREAELRQIYNREWFTQAPLIICAVALPDEGWVRFDGESYAAVDVAIVMDHLILAAADQGLGSCWIGAFDPQAAREVLGLPEQVVPIAFTPIGYPAAPPRVKDRKPLEALVKYERW
jgi:nitroreductase